MTELNLNEMEQVSGGRGGSSSKLPPKGGCSVYRIQGGDNLTKLARRYGTSIEFLMNINEGIIKNRNDITTGCYMYVPNW